MRRGALLLALLLLALLLLAACAEETSEPAPSPASTPYVGSSPTPAPAWDPATCRWVERVLWDDAQADLETRPAGIDSDFLDYTAEVWITIRDLVARGVCHNTPSPEASPWPMYWALDERGQLDSAGVYWAVSWLSYARRLHRDWIGRPPPVAWGVSQEWADQWHRGWVDIYARLLELFQVYYPLPADSPALAGGPPYDAPRGTK